MELLAILNNFTVKIIIRFEEESVFVIKDGITSLTKVTSYGLNNMNFELVSRMVICVLAQG